MLVFCLIYPFWFLSKQQVNCLLKWPKLSCFLYVASFLLPFLSLEALPGLLGFYFLHASCRCVWSRSRLSLQSDCYICIIFTFLIQSWSLQNVREILLSSPFKLIFLLQGFRAPYIAQQRRGRLEPEGLEEPLNQAKMWWSCTVFYSGLVVRLLCKLNRWTRHDAISALLLSVWLYLFCHQLSRG